MNKSRLLKLATHLESGELGHKEFDFSCYNTKKNGTPASPYKCGYAGCAMGELPILFSDTWRFDEDGMPALKDSKGSFDVMEDGMKFFSISGNEYAHLFIPGSQYTTIYGGKTLFGDATPEQVAKNIREFVKIRSK